MRLQRRPVEFEAMKVRPAQSRTTASIVASASNAATAA
jgi:hypothetical protein